MRDDASDEGDAIRAMLLYGFLPAWFVPGILDYFHHRKSKIEDTCGPRESVTHGLMFGIVGVPVTMALLCEIDPPVLAAAVAAALLHEALTLYDVHYAVRRRVTSPAEQHVHSFLEVMPIAGTFMLFAAYPESAKSFARNPLRSFAKLRLKRKRVPPAYLAAIACAIASFIVAPYAEEFARCYARHPTLAELPVDPDLDRLVS